MITRILVKNYRTLRDLTFSPREGMNILVGDNEAGKSTLLEAISLVLTGRINGRRIGEEINPYWFNTDTVDEYFAAIEDGKRPSPPSILIEAYFSQTDEPQMLRGTMNSLREDCPGVRIEIDLDPDFADAFDEYLQSKHPPILPTEYYRVRWVDFRDKPLPRRPRELGLAFIDGRAIRSSVGVDHHTRQMLTDMVDKRDGARISVAYRQARHELTGTVLSTVNKAIKDNTDSLLDQQLQLHMDQSGSSTWEASVVPQVDKVPFAMAGQGQQVMIKTGLALKASSSTTSFVLVEEPENHLSHTSLRKVINSIERLAADRQTFVVTHSSYVLNRLGLNRLHLMQHGTIHGFHELQEETVDYFKRQSGYDTLRIVLARRVVILEGPSDEMLFNRAYKDCTGKTPDDDYIDVITFGTQNRRPLELCTVLSRSAAVLRDADKKTPEHWRALAQESLETGKREMFVGIPADGVTLEPQIIAANAHAEPELREIVHCPEDEDLEDYMSSNKTEVAWLIATSDSPIRYPQYITDAISFIRDA
mgnify:CR=1 FL=1